MSLYIRYVRSYLNKTVPSAGIEVPLGCWTGCLRMSPFRLLPAFNNRTSEITHTYAQTRLQIDTPPRFWPRFILVQFKLRIGWNFRQFKTVRSMCWAGSWVKFTRMLSSCCHSHSVCSMLEPDSAAFTLPGNKRWHSKVRLVVAIPMWLKTRHFTLLSYYPQQQQVSKLLNWEILLNLFHVRIRICWPFNTLRYVTIFKKKKGQWIFSCFLATWLLASCQQLCRIYLKC